MDLMLTNMVPNLLIPTQCETSPHTCIPTTCFTPKVISFLIFVWDKHALKKLFKGSFDNF